jgi:DNA-binding transcriptional LysR family regulator
MNIDTITLQCFLAVAETESITKAASHVGRTQSAVSQQMAKLEQMIGKPLFFRGRGFGLTPEGEIFLSYARQIFALHRAVIDQFKQPELRGELRFGMPEDFANTYLSDILIEFARIHPHILITIECDLTLNLLNRFKNKEFDMVLLKMSQPEDIPYGVNVYSEKLEWVSHPSFVIDTNKPLPLVLSPQPCVYRAKALKALEEANLNWRIIFSSPSYASTIAAVKAGLGISTFARTMIPEQLQALTHSALPSLDNTHICLLKQNSEQPALLSFEEFVIAKLKH